MEVSIGEYDSETRAVTVTFVHAGVTHTRAVNACLDETGAYDAAATKDRVDEVAMGVATKIAVGVISNIAPESLDITTAEPAETPAT
jgi:hypothetical protein